jgi:hypothetical protein
MPTPEDLDPPFRLGRAFQVFTGLLLAALVLALAFGLTHRSSKPAVMGRYSIEYSMVLAILLAAIGALAWVLLRPKPATVRWAGNIYTALASTAVAVAAAEIGLRVVDPWGIELFSTLPYHMQGMVDHPLLGYAHPKSVAYQLGNNRVSLNSNGHRGDEMPVRKPAGERRILILGDSVTFGWGVNQGEEFPARLETLLREQNNVVWRVINAGVNGYNSEQEAIFFATEGIAYEPDIVILVYVANDVEPVIDPKPVTWRRSPTWPSSLPELLERGRSLSYLYQTTKLFQRMHQLELEASAPPLSVTRDVRWPDSLKALRTILDVCGSHGIPFLLATEFSSDVEFFIAMKDAGIDAISLGPAWGEVLPGQRAVSRVDPHPSARVHSEFAKLLLEELRKRGWLETRSAP